MASMLTSSRLAVRAKGVDGPVKPGHDGGVVESGLAFHEPIRLGLVAQLVRAHA